MPAAIDCATPDPVALVRAERARLNGARSRGPVTAMGKARASRNAVKHGLRARLVVPEEDEAAFRGVAERLFAELAPAGELQGFLVADLAAAMWRTGRARRLEAQALAGDEPDVAKLELALRYQGSASRELFRVLRALHGLRRQPLTAEPAQAPEAEEPVTLAMVPADDAPDELLPEVAELAWGGGAAAPPAPPPGCLMLRPIPYHRPRQWHLHQERAFPATARVPVDSQGTVYALVAGRWKPRPWSMEPEPTWPRVASQRPNEPSQALDPAAIPCQPPTVPDPMLTPRHGLSWSDLGLPDHADRPSGAAPCHRRRRPRPQPPRPAASRGSGG